MKKVKCSHVNAEKWDMICVLLNALRRAYGRPQVHKRNPYRGQGALPMSLNKSKGVAAIAEKPNT